MKILDYLKNHREGVLKEKELMKRNMFNIKDDVLFFFGSSLLDFQMNRLSLEQLKSMFNVFGYEVLNDIGYGSNYFLICDSNGQEYDIYVNEDLFEFLAIRGNEEALKCMYAILDWERDFGYNKHKNWISVNRKWVLNSKMVLKH
jgi:hypothetical protein